MNFRALTATGLLVGFVVPATAAPQLLQPVSQARTVEAEATASNSNTVENQQDTDSDSAPDFAVFNTVALAQASVTAATCGGVGTQISMISGDAIVASGTTSASAATSVDGALTVSSGASNLLVVFDVPAGASYTLDGELMSTAKGYVLLRLDGPGGIVAIDSPFNKTLEISQSGILAPGQYALRLDASSGVLSSGVWNDDMSAEFDIELRLTDAEPGTASCFGVGCPCGNDDPLAGCANSGGVGARLTGSGTTSVAADDLTLTALQVPAGNSGLFYMGDAVVQSAFYDGFQCALGTTFRFLGSIQTSTVFGGMSHSGFVAQAGGLIDPGETWHFHAWYRDVPGSPCGTGANLTSLYSVTFQP